MYISILSKYPKLIDVNKDKNVPRYAVRGEKDRERDGDIERAEDRERKRGRQREKESERVRERVREK